MIIRPDREKQGNSEENGKEKALIGLHDGVSTPTSYVQAVTRDHAFQIIAS